MKSNVKKFLSTMCVLASALGVFAPSWAKASSDHEEYGADFSSKVTPGVVLAVYRGKNPCREIWVETIRSAMDYEGRGKRFLKLAVSNMKLSGFSRENIVKLVMLVHFYNLLSSNEYINRFNDYTVNDSKIKEAVVKKVLETEENEETGMKEFLEFIEKEFYTQIERMKIAYKEWRPGKDKVYWTRAFGVWFTLKERILTGKDSTGFRWSHDGLVESILMTYELDWV